MAGELLDFSVSSCVEFADCVRDSQKKVLLDHLNEIRDNGKRVVLDFCALGQRLKELRDGGLWRYVLDANGERYGFDSFYEFCEDVLGFSKTKAQNMISLTAFIRLKDGNVEFLEEAYSKYNTSQLIELSSVEWYKRRLFSPAMSVKDMRMVKSYTSSRWNSTWTPESVLAEARDAEFKKEHLKQQLKLEEEKNLTPSEPSDSDDKTSAESAICAYLLNWPFDDYCRRKIISSYFEKPFELFPMMLRVTATVGSVKREFPLKGFSVQASWWTPADDPEDRCILFSVQTSESVVEEKWNVEKLASVLRRLIKDHLYGFDYEYPSKEQKFEYQDRVEDDEFGGAEFVQGGGLDSDAELEEASAQEEPASPAYCLNTRAERRAFLADYQKWTKNPNPREFSFFGKGVYSVYLDELKLTIYAVEADMLVSDNGVNDTVFYFMMLEGGPVFTSKEYLNTYIASRLTD